MSQAIVSRPIIGLITDFGADFAAGSLKGVVLQSFPDAQVIDVDHSIEKFNTISAAFVIDSVYQYFPKGTIFICVIDPGVGSARQALCVSVDGYTFIGPNNGIFHYLLSKPGCVVRAIKPDAFGKTSVTFHGRDIFTPAAVAVVAGKTFCFTDIDPSHIIGIPLLISDTIVTFIDSFGNIKTNIPVEQLPSEGTLSSVTIDGVEYLIPVVRCFDDVAPGSLLCYKGSNDTLEIAINNGSAAKRLQVKVGNRIIVKHS